MRKILSIAFIVILTINLNAQKFGVKGGLIMSGLTTDVSGDYSLKPGANVSVFFQKTLIPMLSLRPALGYYQKGYTGHSALLGDYAEYLNYVQLDLNLRIKPPLIPIYVFAGPYASYAISGQSKYGSVSVDIDFGKNTYSPFDFGLGAGVGFVKKFAIAHFFAEFGFYKGMTNYNNYSSTVMKNYGITADLGFMIGL